jgi:hypothetical protein
MNCISGIRPRVPESFSVTVFPNPVTNGLAMVSIFMEQSGTENAPRKMISHL